MLNKIEIQGRLVRDPELRATKSDLKVASFRIACDRDFSKSEEKVTDFVDCVAWRSKGEFICRNFHKGDMILVSGRLQIRPWETKEGEKRYATEIVVEDTYFCGGKKDSANNQAAAFEDADISDDELPWGDKADVGDDELPF
jgi:single-strand DNA-binding protein